jgi:cytochrome c553
MSRHVIKALCIGLCALGAGQAAQAEDDPMVNRLLAAQCAQCHGTNGHAVGDMDGLFEESYSELYEELTEMVSDDRPEDIMEHQALGYNEDQIRRIALYYGMRSGTVDEPPETGDGEHEKEEHEEESRRKRATRDR